MQANFVRGMVETLTCAHYRVSRKLQKIMVSDLGTAIFNQFPLVILFIFLKIVTDWAGITKCTVKQTF